ncbi:MAG TPA: UDP-N-acetylmuramate dehydrogenase [Candidatus Krumholzibacteria bacterium]|nr:UDP-N-acetylmuramate dehydrogenase [Candidatus Krumholzibacteria bacterium]
MSTAANWEGVGDALHAIMGERMRAREPMSRHTTIGVGGPVRWMVFPASASEVARTVRCAIAHRVPWFALGKGSNLIVRDGGYEAIVINLSEHMTQVRVNQRTVYAQGGASFAALARKMTKSGRTGLEFGTGIPGTVGGAVHMNAGAFGGDVSEALVSTRIVDATGAMRTVRAADITFTYRHTSLDPRAVVVAATFKCRPGAIRKDVYDRSIGRKQTQPIWERSFGSTFVNPPGKFAAEMIEGCGLKGTRLGGAMISDLHANFIINIEGSATAADVEALIDLARTEVLKRYGVELKTEVVIVGDR